MGLKSFLVRIPGVTVKVLADSVLDASDAFYEVHGVWPTDVVAQASQGSELRRLADVHGGHIRDRVFVAGCEFCDDETTVVS